MHAGRLQQLFLAGGMTNSSKLPLPVHTEDASTQPTAYMMGLPDQVASMADAILVVQATELPVHTYILAANSPVQLSS